MADTIEGAQVAITRYVFDPDDEITITDAAEIKIVDEDSYQRGWDLHASLTAIDKAIVKSHERQKREANDRVNAVRAAEKDDRARVLPFKESLGIDLGEWEKRETARREQEARDQQLAEQARLQAQHVERVEEIERVAIDEPDPAMAEVFINEAIALEQARPQGAPVEPKPVKASSGGHFREYWYAKIDDVKTLMKAFVDGQCVLDEEGLINDGLQAIMNVQAEALHERVSKAYPGVSAYSSRTPVSRRR